MGRSPFFALAIFFCIEALVSGGPLPKVDGNIDVADIIFQLWTQSNPDQGTRLKIGDASTLSAGGFDPSLPTKIIIHGWMDSIDNNVIQHPKRAFLALENMNVIGVGWMACSKNVLYEEAVNCVRQVGDYTGDLVLWLKEETGTPMSLIHGLGHSLGAQAISFVSRRAQIGRITSLDPAGPLFIHEKPENRVDPDDADFVDVVHTSINFLGMVKTAGNVDFYPNGGKDQPGCSDFIGTCSHSAAYYFYDFTVAQNNRNVYLATKCDSVKDAQEQNCSGEAIAPMGYGADPQYTGIYYVNISEVPQ